VTLHLAVALIGFVLGPAAGLIGLWLRLRWRTRQEHARRRTLVALARALRRGSRLEEHAADGTILRITIGHARDGEHVGGVTTMAGTR
jgi:hypothetical protein